MSKLYETLLSLNRNAAAVLATVVSGTEAGAKCLIIDERPVLAPGSEAFFIAHAEEIAAASSGSLISIDGKQVFCERVGSEKKLVICGGGHVAAALVRLAKMIGIPVTVLEDRPQFAHNVLAAGAVQVICDRFAAGLEQISGDADTYFVIMTRGHQYDMDCLEQISQKPHAYIGMMGSRRRVAIVREAMIRERGCDADVINSVHAPIGLPIKAETPEEIAVSVMAEIIQIKNSNGRNEAFPADVLQHAAEASETAPAVMATIITRKGSAPRSVGTKMLIYPDGRCIGTIGGGCAEAEVIRSARMLLDDLSSPAQVIEVNMTENAAADAGMVCGGVISVLLEIVK